MSQEPHYLFIFLPIKLKTSFIKSLKPRGEYMSLYICYSWEVTGYLCVWFCELTLIRQIQRGRVLSSVVLQNNLIHTRILLGNLTERAGAADSVIKTTPDKEYDLKSSEKASFLFCYGCCRKHVYDAKSKKANRQTNKDQLKLKHSQAERQNQKRPLAHDDNR